MKNSKSSPIVHLRFIVAILVANLPKNDAGEALADISKIRMIGL